MSANFKPQRTAAASRGFLAIARLSCFLSGDTTPRLPNTLHCTLHYMYVQYFMSRLQMARLADNFGHTCHGGSQSQTSLAWTMDRLKNFASILAKMDNKVPWPLQLSSYTT